MAEIDAMRLDCECLPFLTASVDVVVTDLPFGKRMGSRSSVRTLYPIALRELARVVRPGTGRMVALTSEYKTALLATTGMHPRLWLLTDFFKINHGGMNCAVLTWQRSCDAYEPVPTS
eukprot:NODE_7548_length_450_cov_43.573566_g6710_i0.p1 GENE.NODE_7548_length_450_cov_43.573566_g6710_i0~~NODE_7548_length_450_cov_43.573566_g6710_i0.p1  ORF type:complete len:133 (-),score=23.92 NODE_7548_length_450_cov_43.573566_g6710_i0:51-404(-)